MWSVSSYCCLTLHCIAGTNQCQLFKQGWVNAMERLLPTVGRRQTFHLLERSRGQNWQDRFHSELDPPSFLALLIFSTGHARRARTLYCGLSGTRTLTVLGQSLHSLALLRTRTDIFTIECQEMLPSYPTETQCCANVGPPSVTLSQHQSRKCIILFPSVQRRNTDILQFTVV